MSCDCPAPTRPSIRYRSGVAKPDHQRRKTRRSLRPTEPTFGIVLDLRDRPPVGSDEVAVIETYLADQISQLLARCTTSTGCAANSNQTPNKGN